MRYEKLNEDELIDYNVGVGRAEAVEVRLEIAPIFQTANQRGACPWEAVSAQ